MEPTGDQTEPSDEELVRLAQQGDQQAFVKLYRRFLPRVYKRVRYQIPERDVEDVTQEVFISVIKSLKSFRGNSQFSTWLFSLTKRRIVDYYRKRRVEQEDIEAVEYKLATTGSSARADDRVLLLTAMNNLPSDYQEVILLRFVDGLKFKEVARVRGQSLEAAKSLFRRAINALRDEIGEVNV